MRKIFLLAATLLLCVSMPARAQEAEAERDRDEVRRAVETYLYAEDAEEKKRVLDPEARILSLDASGGRMRETPVSSAAERRPRGAKTAKAPQKIVSVDVFSDGALVKVVTDLATWGLSATVPQKHFQYVSLFKLRGEWKIVGILMPTTALLKSGNW